MLAVDRNPAAHCRTSDLRAGLIVRTTNDASGEYVLATFPRGTSWIVVTGAGPARSVQRITVRVGQNDSLNLTLNEQPLALEAVVIASTRDNRISEVGAYVTQKQIDALPQATRNFPCFEHLGPDAVFTTD